MVLTLAKMCVQLLHDKGIDDMSLHRRAEALMAIADIFRVSGHLQLSTHEI